MDRVDLERWKPREVARLLALLETERRYYQDIVSNLPVGLVIVSSDLWLLSANRFFRQTFGLKGEEVTRHRIGEVLRVDDLNDRIVEVFTNGVPQHNILYSPPLEGSSQLFRVSILPIRNLEDELESEALLVFQDLTGMEQHAGFPQTKPAEAEEMRPSLIPLPVEAPAGPGSILDNFDALVWECDPTGALTDVSAYAEEMLGHKAEDLLAEPSLWSQRIAPEDEEFVHKLYSDAVANRNRIQLEYRCRTASGMTIWVRESARIQRDRSGNPVKISGVTIDISENRRLTEQLVVSHKMESLSRLTTRVAHDFNNFLMIIGSYGQDLLDLLPRENPLRADVEQIVHATGKVQDLTNKLLSFSRRPVPRTETVDFGQIVSAAISEFSQDRLGSMEMVRILDPDIGTVEADPMQIRSAISAILSAAVDGSKKSGLLTVETVREEVTAIPQNGGSAKTILSISADQWELDEEAQRRLFEPSFMRAEERAPLSEAYWFVTQNHGEIAVRGCAGSGVTIQVSFPTAAVKRPTLRPEPPEAAIEPVKATEKPETAPEPAPPAESTAVLPLPVMPAPAMAPTPVPELEPAPTPPPVQPAEPVPAEAKKEAILVVEDEEGIRTLMRKILVRNGYEVLEADSGKQAMGLAHDRNERIHLLVTDLVMPEMSGRELAEQLRTFLPDLKVIFASGYTDDAVIHSGVLPKGTTYLQKPFSLGALLERVKELLQSAD